VAQIVPLAAALILVSPRLAIGGVVLLVPLGISVAALRRRWRSASARSQSATEELHAGVDELVRGLDLWRSYGAGARIEAAISDLGERATRSQARVDAARAALSGANEVLAALALLGAVVLASALGLPLGDGTLVAFAAVFFMAYRPLRDLGDARAWSLRGEIAFEALDAIGPSSTRPRSGTTARELPLASLELDAFGARDRGPTTSLCVAPGEMVCIVGPTGSGKTTLLRALLGLEPSLGGLVYAGRDLSAAGVGPLERPFAWVPQDAPLITGSVAENVALFGGDEIGALRSIGAEQLLDRKDERVGPGGRPLSGGERRQVAIARALSSGLPVLLLDEPTEGLDAEAEQQVLSALCALRGQRTLVVVTHRDAVARIAARRIAIGAVSSPRPAAAE
jgi:ABC-type multidrug transport system fused ATPase/permease subunit